MVVKIYGTLDDGEYKWGLKLKELLESDSKLQSEKNNIHIIPSVQCYGEKTQDVDIVIFGELDNYSTNVPCKILNHDAETKMREVVIKDFCMVIEVKKHDVENICFQGPNLLVKYRGKNSINSSYKNATLQNRNQMYSVINNLNMKNSMQVFRAIFLPNVSTKQLPDGLNSNMTKSQYILSDTTLDDFWQCLLSQGRDPFRSREGLVFKSTYKDTSDKYIQRCVTKLTKKIQPSHLDRAKMEKISKRQLKNQLYEERLGKQLLIFRGKGGTGKTYRLLSLAHDIYEKRAERTLILTYNRALVADIRRLLALMKISDGVGQSIQIRTVHSFWWNVYSKFGFLNDGNKHESYDSQKYRSELKSILLKEEAESTLKRLSIDYPEIFSWDYVMVDEAQDWPVEERDLLYSIFGFEKIVIADGLKQLIRNDIACNWRNYPDINTSNSQVVSLRTSLRQKPNINRFISSFSEEMGIEDWDVEDNDESYGGRVIVIEGEYNIDMHKEIVQSNKNDNNKNIDMLFCVPPGNIKDGYSSLGKMFEKHDYSVWDGTNKDIRSTYPLNLDDFRILQYDSCRGLEGWVSVNIDLDSFYNYKLNNYTSETGQQVLRSEDEEKRLYAGNWLLIPLTRAIDTLVINIKDMQSPLSQALRRVYDANPDYIEWY